MNERKMSQSGCSNVITVCSDTDGLTEIDYQYSVEKEEDYCYSVGDEKTVVHESDSFADYKNISCLQKRRARAKELLYCLFEIVNTIYLRYSLSIFLENKGSSARDHLGRFRSQIFNILFFSLIFILTHSK
jgi:hypothetical protein